MQIPGPTLQRLDHVYNTPPSIPAYVPRPHSIPPSPCFRLRNDLYCVEWAVKLYSLTPHLAPSFPIFPPLTSRVLLKQLRGLEERCKIPQRSPGRSPGRKRIWCTLKLSESHWQQSFSEFSSACFTKLDLSSAGYGVQLASC